MKTSGDDSFRISIVLIVFFGLISIFYIYLSRIFLDAGFYLYAADQVMSGRLLYKDFFFVQAPVYPYIYGILLRGWGVTVVHARWVSWLFSMSSILLIFRMTRHYLPPQGRMLAIAAVALSPLHAYFCCSVKLYALAGLLFTLAGLFLNSSLSRPIRWNLAAVAAMLASGTRLTLLPGTIVFLTGILVEGWRSDRKPAIGAVLTAGLCGLCLSLPFLLMDSEAVIYNLIGIHTSAETGIYVFGLRHKIKVLFSICKAYPVTVFLCLMLVWRIRGAIAAFHTTRTAWINLIAAAAVTLAHFSANWFSVDYQSVVMPLLTVAVLQILFAAKSDQWITRKLSFGIVLIGLAGLAAGFFKPLWSEWESSIESLEAAGRCIAENTAPGEKIAGCNAIFALEAGREVLDPFGGAPFTFTPRWSEPECRRFGGINTGMIATMLKERKAGALVFEKDSFSIGFPGFFAVSEDEQKLIWDAIRGNYRRIASFPGLGSNEPTLEVFVPQLPQEDSVQ